MADPRMVGRAQMKANLSPLMEAKAHAVQDTKVNFCPFLPGDDEEALEHLDENGYCRHLVGFTVPGSDKLFEPMVRCTNGVRRVQVKRTREKVGQDEHGPVFSEGPPQYERVEKTDKLVKITVSSRVYRDVDEAELEQATRPQAATT